MKETVVHVYCPDCQSFTQPSLSTVHFCLRALRPGEKRSLSDYQPKKWSHTLNCWVLDTSRTHAQDGKYWDAKLGTWVYDPAHKAPMTKTIAEVGKTKAEEIPAPREKKEKTYEVSSCELPPKKVTTNESVSGNYGSKWVSSRPWDGVDRFKYPATFMKLIQMYYSGDWYSVGPYIPDEEYRNRVLKGIYAPEPKKKEPVYSTSSNYRNWQDHDWEGE